MSVLGFSDPRLSLVVDSLQGLPFVNVARLFGSALYGIQNSSDVDIALVVEEELAGIIPSETYSELNRIQHDLSQQSGLDLDFSPRGASDPNDPFSPFYATVFWPALEAGVDLVGVLQLQDYSKHKYDRADILLAGVLFMLVQIRQQVVTNVSGVRGKGLARRALYTPGLIVQVAYERNLPGGQAITGCDYANSFVAIDEVLGVPANTSLPLHETLLEKKRAGVTLEEAIAIVRWVEHLLVRFRQPERVSAQQYISLCQELAHVLSV